MRLGKNGHAQDGGKGSDDLHPERDLCFFAKVEEIDIQCQENKCWNVDLVSKESEECSVSKDEEACKS